VTRPGPAMKSGALRLRSVTQGPAGVRERWNPRTTQATPSHPIPGQKAGVPKGRTCAGCQVVAASRTSGSQPGFPLRHWQCKDQAASRSCAQMSPFVGTATMTSVSASDSAMRPAPRVVEKLRRGLFGRHRDGAPAGTALICSRSPGRVPERPAVGMAPDGRRTRVWGLRWSEPSPAPTRPAVTTFNRRDPDVRRTAGRGVDFNPNLTRVRKGDFREREDVGEPIAAV